MIQSFDTLSPPLPYSEPRAYYLEISLVETVKHTTSGEEVVVALFCVILFQF